MTTTVRVEAHCDDKTVVRVELTDSNLGGESAEFTVYDDRRITVFECEKLEG